MDVDEQRTFKQLTATNWSTPDPVMRMFSLIPETGLPRPATAEDWAGSFLALELSPAVPRNIRDLFEVARGICLYGWFFYPLYQIAEGQLFRVLDGAVGARCEQAGGPKASTSFAVRISWLLKHGVIREEELVRWDGLRNLRNFASHPEIQTIVPPGSVLMSFQLAVLQINALFEAAHVDTAGSAAPSQKER